MCIRIATLVALVMLATGCSKLGAESSATASATPAALSSTEVCRPVKIGVIQDKSGSSGTTRTPQIETSQLQGLVDIVSRCGGELAFGVIHDRRSDTLARLRIEQPPTPPKQMEPDSNPLRRRAQLLEARKLESAYEEAIAEWEQAMSERLDGFLAKVEPLLAGPADARRSPVWESVRRLDLFLNESELAYPNDFGRYAVIISDGRESAKGKPAAVSAYTRVILINGAAEVGSLGPLKPALHESLDSATRFIAGSESAGNVTFARQ